MNLIEQYEKEGYKLKATEKSGYPNNYKARYYTYYSAYLHKEREDVKIIMEKEEAGKIGKLAVQYELTKQEIIELNLNSEHPVMRFLKFYPITRLKDKLEKNLSINTNINNKLKI